MGLLTGQPGDRIGRLAVLAAHTVRSDSVLTTGFNCDAAHSCDKFRVLTESGGMFNPEFLTTDSQDGQPVNGLIQYLQDQSPDVLQRVAKSASNDIQDVIRHNVQGLLGMLPSEQFEVKVTAHRDNLANMLASAMMTGYFLRQMEQRKELEDAMFGDDDMAIGPDEELNL